MKSYRRSATEMLNFVQKSPTAFHAVAGIVEMLLAAGFTELKETEDWKVLPGHGYFVTRNDSAIIAFRIPDVTDGETKDKIKGFHIAASHSDSPSFKIKESSETVADGHYVRINTEKYGGMILSSWLDRPLSVAGRIAMRDKNGEIVTKLVNVDKDLFVIPNLAIHMNREINNGFSYNPQVDMLPLFALCEEGKKSASLMKCVAHAAGIKKEDVLGHDLFLYVREKGRIVGAEDEFILSPRLDDLQCVYTSTKAFLDSKPSEYMNVCAVFDNEEVGSGTKQGADSTFLEDTLFRICESMQLEKREYLKLVTGSFLISADNAHAVHPNHPEKADPTNRPYLNGGIVIKYHGSQKYTTDAVSAAKIRALCEAAKVPFQTFTNRSDLVGGSTLGNISTAHVSVNSADIGLPQLAMHSAVETAGIRDSEYAIRMFQSFFTE